jgi:hypothetical protein
MARYTVLSLAALALLAGCQYVPNYYKETGPSTTAVWDSPTALDVKAHYQSAPQTHRAWPQTVVATEGGAVDHWALWFEDPFEDKGTGRTDEKNPHNVYHIGWEDYFAAAYSPLRFATNTVLWPVSAVVTPPGMVLESDGVISKQLVWRDHDATRLSEAEKERAALFPTTQAVEAPEAAPIQEQPPLGEPAGAHP